MNYSKQHCKVEDQKYFPYFYFGIAADVFSYFAFGRVKKANREAELVYNKDG